MMTDTNRPAATIGISDEQTPAAALPKTATITLTASDGSVLQLVAERTKDAAKSYAVTIKDKKSARGMSQAHESFEAAVAATQKMALEAVKKLGWARKVTRQGFVAKPDAFSSLPAAPKAAKK